MALSPLLAFASRSSFAASATLFQSNFCLLYFCISCYLKQFTHMVNPTFHFHKFFVNIAFFCILTERQPTFHFHFCINIFFTTVSFTKTSRKYTSDQCQKIIDTFAQRHQETSQTYTSLYVLWSKLVFNGDKHLLVLSRLLSVVNVLFNVVIGDLFERLLFVGWPATAINYLILSSL